FFFQAEDGIRDFHVTGVQTCALPISGYLQFSASSANLTSWVHVLKFKFKLYLQPGFTRILAIEKFVLVSSSMVMVPKFKVLLVRSEERRVGKESRYWWSRLHEKKKEE